VTNYVVRHVGGTESVVSACSKPEALRSARRDLPVEFGYVVGVRGLGEDPSKEVRATDQCEFCDAIRLSDGSGASLRLCRETESDHWGLLCDECRPAHYMTEVAS
jgi:hypothetical protein